MQKALTQMNIQLANVISDLSGVTGQLIVRAIIAGERDPWKLAQLSHPRIQPAAQRLPKAWKVPGVQNLSLFCSRNSRCMTPTSDGLQSATSNYRSTWLAFADTVAPPAKEDLPPKKKKKQNKNNPHFHLADELQRITGVDLTRIARSRNSSRPQPGRHCPASGSLNLAKKPDLSRCAVPTPTQQARCPESHHCHGSSLARLVYRMLKYGQQ
jgi:hypothetical protein